MLCVPIVLSSRSQSLLITYYRPLALAYSMMQKVALAKLIFRVFFVSLFEVHLLSFSHFLTLHCHLYVVRQNFYFSCDKFNV